MTHPIQPPEGQLTVYATTWCPFCARLLQALGDSEVKVQVIDVDRDEEAGRFVESVNGGNRVVPTVVFPGGAVVTNPAPEVAVLTVRGAA